MLLLMSLRCIPLAYPSRDLSQCCSLVACTPNYADARHSDDVMLAGTPTSAGAGAGGVLKKKTTSDGKGKGPKAFPSKVADNAWEGCYRVEPVEKGTCVVAAEAVCSGLSSICYENYQLLHTFHTNSL